MKAVPAASTRRENGTWTAHVPWRVDGKRKQLKRGGFTTERAAQAELTRLMRSVRTGQAVATPRTTVGSTSPNGSPIVGPWRAASCRRSVLRGEDHLVPSPDGWNRGPAAAHCGASSTGCIATWRIVASRPRSIRYVHSIVRKALRDAERTGPGRAQPATRVEPTAARAARAPQFTVWTPADLAPFLAHIDGRPHGVLGFAVFTGARRAEVCGLLWADVDLEARARRPRGRHRTHRRRHSHRERTQIHEALRARPRRRPPSPAAAPPRRTIEWRLVVGSGWRHRGLVFSAPAGDHLRRTFSRTRSAATPRPRPAEDPAARSSPRSRLVASSSHRAHPGDDPRPPRPRQRRNSTLDNYVHPSRRHAKSAAAKRSPSPSTSPARRARTRCAVTRLSTSPPTRSPPRPDDRLINPT